MNRKICYPEKAVSCKMQKHTDVYLCNTYKILGGGYENCVKRLDAGSRL